MRHRTDAMFGAPYNPLPSNVSGPLLVWTEEVLTMPTQTASHNFEYQGWNVTLLLDRINYEGIVSGHAELRANDANVCRLSLATPRHDGASALIDLAKRARAFIDNWTEHADAGVHTG